MVGPPFLSISAPCSSFGWYFCLLSWAPCGCVLRTACLAGWISIWLRRNFVLASQKRLPLLVAVCDSALFVHGNAHLLEVQ